ncbi:hypothetical protein DYB35_009690 [Aphanomyces astaci]|uniref:Uncharacterized protein n=1 Tax=Aphanomyces astaci TaxID=112090 RepID=A0A418D1T2_APHAT|nr:hypothetical protein DYB35_009690 [Aphanomyces astaci]
MGVGRFVPVLLSFGGLYITLLICLAASTAGGRGVALITGIGMWFYLYRFRATIRLAFQIPGSQPYAAASDGSQIMRGQWKSGLFHCCDHPVPNGLMCCCCPCVLLAQVVGRLGLFDYVLTLLVLFLLSCTGFGGLLVAAFVVYLRAHVRRWFGVPGSVLEDICVGCCCCGCAIAQMATHVDAYTPGKCSLESKDALPGYQTQFQHQSPPPPHAASTSYDAPSSAATFSEHV